MGCSTASLQARTELSDSSSDALRARGQPLVLPVLIFLSLGAHVGTTDGTNCIFLLHHNLPITRCMRGLSKLENALFYRQAAILLRETVGFRNENTETQEWPCIIAGGMLAFLQTYANRC